MAPPNAPKLLLLRYIVVRLRVVRLPSWTTTLLSFPVLCVRPRGARGPCVVRTTCLLLHEGCSAPLQRKPRRGPPHWLPNLRLAYGTCSLNSTPRCACGRRYMTHTQSNERARRSRCPTRGPLAANRGCRGCHGLKGRVGHRRILVSMFLGSSSFAALGL